MQILDERGDTATPAGQRVVSILLLEDLAIVPLLAIVALLAPARAAGRQAARWLAIGDRARRHRGAPRRPDAGCSTRCSACSPPPQAREVMTAAALLVVLGAALVMQLGGLSMAMGAFLAGVLLSESTFRHQLEADIEPFRGILLGLFFLGVGMSLDLARDRAALAADPAPACRPSCWSRRPASTSSRGCSGRSHREASIARR